VLFNLAAVLLLLWKGQFRSDWTSVVAVILAFALMNAVAWISSRNYKEWK
jgi:NADH:ubiquinone oxidoreductase subunit 3 (subunit A)